MDVSGVYRPYVDLNACCECRCEYAKLGSFFSLPYHVSRSLCVGSRTWARSPLKSYVLSTTVNT